MFGLWLVVIALVLLLVPRGDHAGAGFCERLLLAVCVAGFLIVVAVGCALVT